MQALKGERALRVKAIFFDLDDTLFDCHSQLTGAASLRTRVRNLSTGMRTMRLIELWS